MKTFLKILYCAAFVTLVMSGCKKDAEDTLVGTSWVQVDSGITVIWRFTSSINCHRIIVDYNTSSYTYEYEHPNVRMYPTDSENAELKGIINGDTMNVINISTGKTIDIVVKQ